MDTPIPWHRLFGIALTDLFTDRPWRVELEKELALKSQRLDILIIERRPGAARTIDPHSLADLPDGLDTLAAHNVLTYKSQHQALDAWALDELLGHYVTYRKLLSIQANQRYAAGPDLGGEQAEPPLPSDRLVPVTDFRLYAVATRLPEKLLGQLAPGVLQPTPCPGVQDLRWGGMVIRLIVLNAIASQARNAPWELFSAQLDRIRHGLRHYHPRDQGATDLLAQLYFNYRVEMPEMAYTMEDFKHDARRVWIEHIQEFDPEERDALLARMAVEDLLRVIKPEDLLRILKPEDRLRGLDPEDLLRELKPEDRLRGLDPDFIKSWLRRNEH